MRTGTWNARILSSLVVGLLVLAGLSFDGRHTLAQAQVACVPPEGEEAPEDPEVTAKQVEEGSATLESFTLGAREQFEGVGSKTLTPQQLAYSGCRLREEGGPWYYGSTYLVTPQPDGRVYLHAKNMSLSAGKLQPTIYAQILRALGTPPAALQGLLSMDSAALLEHLRSGPHGPFSLTEGGSGYAAAYVSVNTGNPFVLLAGFDLNPSHLAEEALEYGDPAIRADEVVDRYTLKKFVTEALKFIAQRVISAPTLAESRVAFQKAKLALRDPNGPWRHGPVYVTIQDPDTDLILFHGAFPNRFELQRGGISRDAITGDLIYDQLLDAANSSPDGGF